MTNDNKLTYDGTVSTSSKGTAILGKLTGPCADIIHPTRNGRKYSEELWEKVFKDPIVLEYFNCGGIFGELNHPADREETDLTKVCICMPEPPKKDKNGVLVGSWDILDTPNGRILKCLCDYGYKIGISSRGSGDTFTDTDGQEAVDPETYSFQGFDIVYLPAVKNARLQYEGLHESFNTKPTFRTALQEQFKRSSDSDRKVMVETLKDLNIGYFPNWGNDKAVSSKKKEADNSGSRIMEELQKALRENKRLKNEVVSLQEQLSVCYAKEESYKSGAEANKAAIAKLTESAKQASALKEKHKKLDEKFNSMQKEDLESKSVLLEKLENEQNANQRLSEQLDVSKSSIKELKAQVASLKESVSKQKAASNSLNEEFIRCKEELAELKKDMSIKAAESKSKMDSSKKLVEKYKAIARRSVDKYIENQAIMLGVATEDIKNRLSENYSFDEIDSVCENLQQVALSMNSLPFSAPVNSNKKELNVRMKINESKESIVPASRFDDDIDDGLLSLAGL